MTAPNLQPLVALLASHPEECAAVVAMLASEGSTEHSGPWSYFGLAEASGQSGNITAEIGHALVDAGIVEGRGAQGCTAPRRADRYAIARMGAAAWLAARCGGEAVAP